jgi:protein gp37
MAQLSHIEWTDSTWNPVTGCTKVSSGCKNCYAETFAERFRGVAGHPYEQGFDLRLWPERLTLPLSWKKPRRVFVNSMSDLFHEDVPFSFVEKAFYTMREARWHEFQILTKRVDRLASFVGRLVPKWGDLSKTCPNIWIGASVEKQELVNRASTISQLPFAVRFLSCEPLLGPLDLRAYLSAEMINWVIVGGESGRNARPMDSTWVTAIRDQCQAASVPFFFKQWGGRIKSLAGRMLEERTWDEYPDASIHHLHAGASH